MASTAERQSDVIPILQRLAERGWTPLRSMAVLLDYAFEESIYERQKGKNPIPVVRVGRTNRVYEDTVVDLLTQRSTTDTDAQVILNLYKRVKTNVESLRTT